MGFVNSRLITFTLFLMLATGFFSCKKQDRISIGGISGPKTVCFGEKGVTYSIDGNTTADYILWTVPDLCQIVSGQGKNKIVVNFGRNAGKIIASYYGKGEKISDDTSILVSFGVGNNWCREADFKGGLSFDCVGFSIGSKGYFGTGFNNDSTPRNDFWEFDAPSSTWTQKTDFAGPGRGGAVGFSIAGKGYIGTGYRGTGNSTSDYFKDFWEYIPQTNQWLQKADCSDTARSYAVGFSIGDKGYIGSGTSPYGLKNDFREYDPGTNTWILRAPIVARWAGTGFSIGNKGYFGFGHSLSNFEKDFWEYNPQSNEWLQRSNLPLPGVGRSNAIGFSIDSNGYIALGYNSNSAPYSLIELWKYSPTLNTWESQEDFVGQKRVFATGFSIGNKAYLGTGFIGGSNVHSLNDFWVYTQ